MRILLDSLSCSCCVNKRKMATSFVKAIGDKINICDTGPHWTYTQNPLRQIISHGLEV